jgi:hypothetical protein
MFFQQITLMYFLEVLSLERYCLNSFFFFEKLVKEDLTNLLSRKRIPMSARNLASNGNQNSFGFVKLKIQALTLSHSMVCHQFLYLVLVPNNLKESSVILFLHTLRLTSAENLLMLTKIYMLTDETHSFVTASQVVYNNSDSFTWLSVIVAMSFQIQLPVWWRGFAQSGMLLRCTQLPAIHELKMQARFSIGENRTKRESPTSCIQESRSFTEFFCLAW